MTKLDEEPTENSTAVVLPHTPARLSLGMSPEPILFALSVGAPAVITGLLAALLHAHNVTDWVVLPLVVITALAVIPAVALIVLEFFGVVIPYFVKRWRFHFDRIPSRHKALENSDESGDSGLVVNGQEGESFDVYIGKGSVWSNPYVIGRDGDRATVMARFEEYLLASPTLMARLPELRGKRLGCFCKPKDCHGHILTRYAEISENGLDNSASPTVTS